MEVIQQEVGLLSNFEVYHLLRSTKKAGKLSKNNGASENLATVMYETTGFLSKTPCGYQNSSVIAQFLKALQPYQLTKAEKLQLLNLRPCSPVELQPIIEEIEERFTESDITEILAAVTDILPDDEYQQKTSSCVSDDKHEHAHVDKAQ